MSSEMSYGLGPIFFRLHFPRNIKVEKLISNIVDMQFQIALGKHDVDANTFNIIGRMQKRISSNVDVSGWPCGVSWILSPDGDENIGTSVGPPPKLDRSKADLKPFREDFLETGGLIL